MGDEIQNAGSQLQNTVGTPAWAFVAGNGETVAVSSAE